MIRRLLRLFTASAVQPAGADFVSDPETVRAQILEQMRAFSAEPYFQIADEKLGLLSVFDDLKYDRADVDMISPAMRKHLVGKLGPLGFHQISGTVLEQPHADMRVYIPKFHALGASPFDITRYTEKRPQDYCLLTPTQVACQYVDHYELDDAVQRIEALIAKHPINLLKLADYLEGKPKHRAFREVLGHIKLKQRLAVESEPLCRRRSLG
ncbi:hypothetical protein [Ruegeria profundi]|uniref:hypothetical protein n=1 Tax=Ruegeria profundi TaxID=1685378 RepID=UPI001CD1BCB3|nr:hypothetical protein [Ruegeria profundi]MCA0930605.1 hypothetical protein [Ruegeria profundi]